MCCGGDGAINVDGCRVATDDEAKPRDQKKSDEYFINKKPITHIPFQNGGRWPANVLHDGRREVVEAFPDSNGSGSISNRSSPKTTGIYGAMSGEGERWAGYADEGSAARFFYSAKADSDDRLGSRHPTAGTSCNGCVGS